MKRAAAVIYTLEDQLQSAWDAFDAEHKLCEDLTLELAAEREKSKRLAGELKDDDCSAVFQSAQVPW